MDPDANLKEQLELAVRLQESWEEMDAFAVHRLCELVLALDEWIKRGGFLPQTWRRAP